jgi:hypothetical protein
MTGSNAGVRRNRLPAGMKAVKKQISFAEETHKALDEARKASGTLSLSLYLERLVQQLEAQNGGSLPVFSPELDFTEAHTTAA